MIFEEMNLPGPSDDALAQLAERLGVSREQAEQIAFQMEYPELAAEFNERMAYADALRDPLTPATRQAGRLTVAASPFEHMADLLRAHMGGKEARKVREERAQAREDLRGSAAAGSLAAANLRQGEMDLLMEFLRGDQTPADTSPAAPAAAPTQPVSSPTGVPSRQPPPINPQLTLRQPPPPQRPLSGVGPLMPNPGEQMVDNLTQQTLRTPPPQQPGWFDQNPARQAMQERLRRLTSWQGVAGDRSPMARRRGFVPPAPPTPGYPEALPPVSYPWPGGR